jgi:hypothetical protein
VCVLQTIEGVGKLAFVQDYSYPALGEEPLRSRKLMVVAMLAKSGTARHDQDRFPEFERRDDRPHTSVGDDCAGALHVLPELTRGDELMGLDVLRDVT